MRTSLRTWEPAYEQANYGVYWSNSIDIQLQFILVDRNLHKKSFETMVTMLLLTLRHIQSSINGELLVLQLRATYSIKVDVRSLLRSLVKLPQKESLGIQRVFALVRWNSHLPYASFLNCRPAMPAISSRWRGQLSKEMETWNCCLLCCWCSMGCVVSWCGKCNPVLSYWFRDTSWIPRGG